MAVGLKICQARSAQDVGEAEAPQLQAVGGLRRQRTARGDGVAPALPAAQVSRRARAQQQALRVGLRCLLEEGAEPPAAGVALAAGSRARLPVGLAKAATFAIKSAQHGELEAEVPLCGESGTKSLVLYANLASLGSHSPPSALTSKVVVARGRGGRKGALLRVSHS